MPGKKKSPDPRDAALALRRHLTTTPLGTEIIGAVTLATGIAGAGEAAGSGASPPPLRRAGATDSMMQSGDLRQHIPVPARSAARQDVFGTLPLPAQGNSNASNQPADYGTMPDYPELQPRPADYGWLPPRDDQDQPPSPPPGRHDDTSR